ncbi:hypothetical protein RhiJN_24480 [Ceratobasidium sp. AG-Ba]|nr:hypothetical protein RhiJN_24480 [Ceratobasidium sp. AG-Ba]
MGKAFFNNAEVTFLQEFLDDWMVLKQGNNGLSVTEQVKACNQLVHRVIEEFYETFPERNLTQNDPTKKTYTQEQRKGLYAKIKKTITTRILISKHYTKDILAITQHIQSEDPSLPRMAARNQATTQFIEEMKAEDPDEYECFQILAQEVHEAAQTDYAEKSEEALRK